ncbi:copper chaperone PCu(A)C [Alcanivorax sp.]|jgi:copper(I)-binding protein|uniref:copper chaperone PCu(A)C n=1 Tax=Alcanivorax sp. TaxID=1872427 RepID=UPI0032D91B22
MLNHFYKKTCQGAVLAAVLCSGFAHADVSISEGWLRAVPPVSPTMAGYLTVTNNGASSVKIMGASSEVAGHTMLHSMKTLEDGTRKMGHLHHIMLESGESFSLSPGGDHLMLMKLQRVPQPGESVTVCLMPAEGDAICADLPVLRERPSAF